MMDDDRRVSNIIIVPQKPSFRAQYLAAVCTSLGAMSVGTVLGYASPALYQLRESNSSDVTPTTTNKLFNDELTLSTNELSWFSAAFSIGALIGGLICSPLMKVFGRRGTMIVSSIPSSIGWLLLGFGVNFGMLVAGRIFTGLFTGIACASVPVYIGEIASPKIRGSLGISFQLMLGMGIVYAYTFGSFLQWYSLAFVCWIPALAFSISMFFQPESPISYIIRGKPSNAEQSLIKLRGSHYDISKEFAESKAAYELIRDEKFSMSVLKEPTNYKPVLIILGVMALQQLCGINALTFNLATIFAQTGSSMSENVSSIICALVQALSAIPVGLVVDKTGRKILLLVSAGIMAVSQTSMGVYFYVLAKDEDFAITYLSWLPIFNVIVFVIGFSLGFGSVPWILIGEMFPLSIRESASALSIGFNWTASFIVVYSFEYLIAAFYSYGFFWYFAAWCVVSFFFVLIFVKETKGKTLEEIADMFKK